MADPFPIRPITEDEYAAWRGVYDHAFHALPAREDELPRLRRLFEAERSLAAFDPALPPDAGPIGRAGIYSMTMAVPGAVLPAAGVSYVAVLPTYRRRGILRSMMRRQLTDIAARGEEPIAALWASEAPLYGRYGYGRASWMVTLSFGRGEGALAPTAPTDATLSLRLAEPAAAVAELAKVYEAVLPSRPGFFARSADWWDRYLGFPEEDKPGVPPLRCVLAADESGIRGYALYKATERWDDAWFIADSTLEVTELVAVDPAAGAALWADLLGRDLVSQVTAPLRPADDPILFQLADPRRTRPQLADALWVRIIDLPAALTRRRYSCPVDVVFEITDDLLPANAGRWRLTASGPESGVAVERTEQDADVALDIRDLSSAYLGGTRLGTLAAAGLVRELRPGTLLPLSAALAWDPAPWCPRIF